MWRLESYQEDDLPVTVGSGQVEGCVVSHVGGVHPGPTLDEKGDETGVALLGGPVERAETVVIPNQSKSC